MVYCNKIIKNYNFNFLGAGFTLYLSRPVTSFPLTMTGFSLIDTMTRMETAALENTNIMPKMVIIIPYVRLVVSMVQLGAFEFAMYVEP